MKGNKGLSHLHCLNFCFVSAVAYTGTIKLKQSWLDEFQDGESAESKILTGNIEQAVSRLKSNNGKQCLTVELNIEFFRKAPFRLGARSRFVGTGTSLEIAYCQCPSKNLGIVPGHGRYP